MFAPRKVDFAAEAQRRRGKKTAAEIQRPESVKIHDPQIVV
jgi:hypothetical protein